MLSFHHVVSSSELQPHLWAQILRRCITSTSGVLAGMWRSWGRCWSIVVCCSWTPTRVMIHRWWTVASTSTAVRRWWWWRWLYLEILQLMQLLLLLLFSLFLLGFLFCVLHSFRFLCSLVWLEVLLQKTLTPASLHRFLNSALQLRQYSLIALAPNK